ncbi:MAG: hypothetical protein WCG78_07595, partial [Candidatus Omnitrophota bacterium]
VTLIYCSNSDREFLAAANRVIGNDGRPVGLVGGYSIKAIEEMLNGSDTISVYPLRNLEVGTESFYFEPHPFVIRGDEPTKREIIRSTLAGISSGITAYCPADGRLYITIDNNMGFHRVEWARWEICNEDGTRTLAFMPYGALMELQRVGKVVLRPPHYCFSGSPTELYRLLDDHRLTCAILPSEPLPVAVERVFLGESGSGASVLRPVARGERTALSTAWKEVAATSRIGLDYAQAVQCSHYLRVTGGRVPYGFWNKRATLKNMVLVALDQLLDEEYGSFGEARKKGDITAMAQIYRRKVMNYVPVNTGKYAHGGAEIFFYEVAGLTEHILATSPYLRTRRGGRIRKLLDFAVPGLCDDSKESALSAKEAALPLRKIGDVKIRASRQKLADLLAQPSDVDWSMNPYRVRALKGCDFGRTLTGGYLQVFMSAAGDYVTVSLLGEAKGGLRVVCEDIRIINEHLCEVDLVFYEGAAIYKKRTLQIGSHTKEYTCGEYVLKLRSLSDELGTLALMDTMRSAAVRQGTWFIRGRDLTGYKLGDTDKIGMKDLTPYRNHTMRWDALNGIPRVNKRYRNGVIMASGMIDGQPAHLIRWSREKSRDIWRLYRIGPGRASVEGANELRGTRRCPPVARIYALEWKIGDTGEKLAARLLPFAGTPLNRIRSVRADPAFSVLRPMAAGERI